MKKGLFISFEGGALCLSASIRVSIKEVKKLEYPGPLIVGTQNKISRKETKVKIQAGMSHRRLMRSLHPMTNYTKTHGQNISSFYFSYV
jgi:hypothetical protein